MTKGEWENLYNQLSAYKSDFSSEYIMFEHGPSKKSRNAAEVNMYRIIDSAIRCIRNSKEGFILFLADRDIKLSDDHFNEFSKARFFEYNLDNYLNDLKDRIGTL